jgi:hypothetical protein
MEEVIMLQLDKEYTYKEICSVFGWKATSGNGKQKQIKAIEDAYEFYHPENNKTHKLKKSYIFTKKLKDIDMVDNRINNGANKRIFSQEEFDYLLNHMLNTSKRYQVWSSEVSEKNYCAYITSSIIYQNFGLDIYKYLNEIRYVKDDSVVKCIFENICISTLRTFTISRICRKYGYKDYVLPKGVIRQKSRDNDNMIPDDSLLEEYNEYEKIALKKRLCKNVPMAVNKGVYLDVLAEIKGKFKSEKLAWEYIK